MHTAVCARAVFVMLCLNISSGKVSGFQLAHVNGSAIVDGDKYFMHAAVSARAVCVML
jgi:hypothetical protein